MSLFYDFNASSVVERVKMKWPCEARTIPAGTPMSREGIANDGNAIGILANTERMKFGPCNFAIITAGFVDRTKAEASFGEAYSDEAIAAMANINFISEEKPEIGGGASSWNDLTDKPFYAEPVPLYEVFAEKTLNKEGPGFLILDELHLNEGEEYRVKYNSVEYTCLARAVGSGEEKMIVLGNLSLTGDPKVTDPDLPFLLRNIFTGSIYGVVTPLDEAESVTLGIARGGGEKIAKLDNKFLDLEWIPAPKKTEEVVYDGNISLSNSGTTDIVLPALFLLTAGNEYKITTSEGVNCKCTAKSVTIGLESGNQILSWIGNNSLSSYIFSNNGIEVEDTGEAFCYYTMQMSDGSSAYCFTSAERGKRDITVKAIETAEIREPIPQAYLPAGAGGGFYDVPMSNELIGVLKGEGMPEGELIIEHPGAYEAVTSGKSIRFVGDISADGKTLKFVILPQMYQAASIDGTNMVATQFFAINYDTLAPEMLSVTIIG